MTTEHDRTLRDGQWAWPSPRRVLHGDAREAERPAEPLDA